jgi:heptosyltransferase-2
LTNILIVGPAWIGDMVMAHSLVRLLHDRYPQAAIDIAAPAWSHAIIRRMQEVRAAIEIPFKHGEFKPRARWRWGKALRDRHYDWVIVLPTTWKSALLVSGSKIPRRTGFVGESRYGLLNDLRPLDKYALPLMVQRYLALGLDKDETVPEKFQMPRLTVSLENQRQVLQKLGLPTPQNPILVMCPGAEYGPSKRWPTRYFAEVAKAKIAQGWQAWIMGSAKESELGDEIVNVAGGQCYNLAGKTDLADAVDLMAMASAVLTNDSGLMHVAAAVDVPIYAVFGSSTPAHTPPLSDKAKIVSLDLPCSPCFRKQCQYGHYDCVKKLMPEQVLVEMRADENS